MSSDQVLIVNDKVCLSNSTNALTVFKNLTKLKSAQFIDYSCKSDFFIPDFSLKGL
jgi:hypothetical protein